VIFHYIKVDKQDYITHAATWQLKMAADRTLLLLLNNKLECFTFYTLSGHYTQLKLAAIIKRSSLLCLSINCTPNEFYRKRTSLDRKSFKTVTILGSHTLITLNSLWMLNVSLNCCQGVHRNAQISIDPTDVH